MGGMVDEEMSAMAYESYKYGGILTAIFSVFGIGCSVLASEINFFFNED